MLGRKECLNHRRQLQRPAPPFTRITCRFSSGSGIGKNPSPGSRPKKQPSTSSSPTPSSPSSPQQAKALPPPLASFPWAPLLSSILARFHSLLSVSFSLLLLPYLLSSSLGELAFALRQQQVLLAGATALTGCLGCYWLMEQAGKELGGLMKGEGAVGKVLALVVQLCQTSPASSATRQFVQRNYADLKQQNPHLPILIRECSGVQPRITARYDYGVEHSMALEGLSEEQIDGKLKELLDLGKMAAADAAAAKQ
ncbi:unnamed protein product [Closterium sp. NIES-64]|nr:unnamed protein product [Closterium sp. NIES-64]CAI6008458.1 unnamed protein product [Closterium sp. NIES-65]